MYNGPEKTCCVFRKPRIRDVVLLQESGLARILLPELGLETVMRIDRPAKPGDQLDIRVSFIDVPKGIFRFHEAPLGSVSSMESTDVEVVLSEPEAVLDEVSVPAA